MIVEVIMPVAMGYNVDSLQRGLEGAHCRERRRWLVMVRMLFELCNW